MKDVVNKLLKVGRAYQLIILLLDDDIFDSLSKHDPYWQDEDETVDDKLHQLRCKIQHMSDQLWDVIALIDTEDEENATH